MLHLSFRTSRIEEPQRFFFYQDSLMERTWWVYVLVSTAPCFWCINRTAPPPPYGDPSMIFARVIFFTPFFAASSGRLQPWPSVGRSPLSFDRSGLG